MDLPTFLRTYKTRAANIHWFLGAGASVNAGIKSAWEMTWEFKRDIYCSENGKSIASIGDLSNPRVREFIQGYLNTQNAHPIENSLDEYSHYFSLAYRSESDRRRYIEKKIKDAEIKFSHRVLAALMGAGVCKAIWTTNFDSIIEDGWQSLGMPLSRLNVASIDNSVKASQCLREDRFPLYVKLHGDFQSTTLKNTSEELKKQDQDFRSALADLVGIKNGFAFVGYSGRDNSIMEVFESIIEKADKDYPGLFWFNRSGSKVIPRVQQLIDEAKQKDIDAHIVDIPSFDELMLQIYKFLNEELSDFTEYLQPTLQRHSPVELKISEDNTDVIRFNAFKILSVPQSVYIFETEIGGLKEVKELIKGRGKVLATRVKEGVLAFGDRDEIANAFSVKDKSLIHVQPFKVKDYRSSEIFLLYQVLAKIFCQILPLKSYQSGQGLTLFIDPNSTDDKLFIPIINSISSKWDKTPKVKGNTPGLNRYWSEAIQLRLEERMGSLWLVINPTIYIEQGERSWDDPNYIRQEEFRKKRLGGRYNKKADDLFEAWAYCLGLDRRKAGEPAISYKAFKDELGVNPVIEFSTISAFSNGVVNA